MPYFFRKLGKMSENVSSAAVVIGALRVKSCSVQLHLIKIIKENICSSSLKFGIYRTWVMSYFKHARAAIYISEPSLLA